jgi:hypothetical protein
MAAYSIQSLFCVYIVHCGECDQGHILQHQEEVFIVLLFEWWSEAQSHGIRPQMGP